MSRDRLVLRATKCQDNLLRAIEKEIQKGTTGAEKVKRIRKDIVNINILLINYYLCLYSSVYRTFKTSQTATTS